MAKVFLSYDRDDLDKARSLALALEKGGHRVWWDRQIKGGSEYTKEIERALKQADAVIVLWSAHSVESAWVRDEAAAGRDRGRLVPALLGDTEPPLGFRQLQNIDLTRWKGRIRAPEFRQLLDAVETTAEGGQPAESVSLARPVRLPVPRQLRPALFSALAVAILLVAVAIGWWLILRPSSTPVVAVASADSSPSSQALARDLLVKLGMFQASNQDALQLASPGEGGKATALLFNVTARTESGHPEATLALFDGKGRILLWSKAFEQPAGKLADLRQQVAYTAALVLACASEGLPTNGRRLDQKTLKLYLNGCAAYADKTGADAKLLPIFLQVTRQAPHFRGGWAKLLLVETDFALESYLPESPRVIASLPAHISAARKLDPNMPEAFLAEAALLPDNAFEQRIRLLERATEEDPQNSPALDMLSDNLLKVGRMHEGVNEAQRAVRADPLSATAWDLLIAALAAAGRTDAALAELQRAEQLWPGASSVENARFRIHLRYGDPAEALRMIRSRQELAYGAPHFLEAYLQARIDPTPAKIDHAIAQARAAYEQTPSVIWHLAQVLGTFHREDDLYSILLNWQHPEKVRHVTDVLFRPMLRDFRRDPRMIAVAKRLGLVGYWQDTGKWPDFCSEPDLPYDCQTEAAKLAA